MKDRSVFLLFKATSGPFLPFEDWISEFGRESPDLGSILGRPSFKGVQIMDSLVGHTQPVDSEPAGDSLP